MCAATDLRRIDLKHKVQALPVTADWQVTYALFSKSGFTPDLANLAQDEGIMLVGPEELVAERPDVSAPRPAQ